MASPSPTVPILGGVLAAIGASLCCVVPLVLVLLGIGGAWVSLLTDMRPYTPYFLVAVAALFGWAGFQLYRPVDRCKPGSLCAIPSTRRRYRLLFWAAALFSLVLVTAIYATADTRTVTLDTPKMDCPLCPMTIEAALSKIDGVSKVEASLDTRSATVTFDDSRAKVDDLTAATSNAGYPSTVNQ